MQAMPAIPADTQAPPVRPDQAAAPAREDSTFRNHLAAATGKHAQQKRSASDDGRKTASGSRDNTTPAAGHRHRTGKHPARQEMHAGREPAAGEDAEHAAEQTAAPIQEQTGRPEGISLTAILASLTVDKTDQAAAPTQQALTGKEDSPASGRGQTDAQGTTLTSLLQAGTRTATRKPAAGMNHAVPATTPVADTAGGASQAGPGRGEVVVEHWSATFSSRMTGQASRGTAAGNTTAATDSPAVSLTSQPGTDSTIGQTLVSVQRIGEGEEMLPAAPSGARAQQVDTGGQRQDINSSYIHANLPNQATRGEGGGTGNGQQPGGDRGQDTPDLRTGGDQVRQQQGSPATGDQPLVFSLDQAGGIGVTSGHQVTSGSTPLHQAPGLPVSDAHVMDQVIQRFSTDRQLESGTMVLRLHPQELGELRMEIRVEQDNIKAHITTNNPQVQEILDRHLPRLREALEQQGMNLEQMQVTVASGDNSNTQLFQEHRGRQETRRSVRTIGTNRPVFTIPDEEQEAAGLQAGDRNLSILA